MTLEVPLSLQPMEAVPVDDLPTGKGWMFEQKYNGLRCVLFREDDTVNLQSRRQRPLGRFFPRSSMPPVTCRSRSSCSTESL
jgi:ATP-dependent DNA ligase